MFHHQRARELDMRPPARPLGLHPPLPCPLCEDSCCHQGSARVGPDVWMTAVGVDNGGCDRALALR